MFGMNDAFVGAAAKKPAAKTHAKKSTPKKATKKSSGGTNVKAAILKSMLELTKGHAIVTITLQKLRTHVMANNKIARAMTVTKAAKKLLEAGKLGQGTTKGRGGGAARPNTFRLVAAKKKGPSAAEKRKKKSAAAKAKREKAKAKKAASKAKKAAKKAASKAKKDAKKAAKAAKKTKKSKTKKAKKATKKVVKKKGGSKKVKKAIVKKSKWDRWEYLVKCEDVPGDTTITHKVFFDITLDGQPEGRVVITCSPTAGFLEVHGLPTSAWQTRPGRS